MVMEITLKRKYFKKNYTIGKLYLNGEYFCDTLEDTVRDINKNGKFDNGEFKIKHKTAIPYGVYKIQMYYSHKFKEYLPLLLNVPSFEGILIHAGNSETDSSGCILVGENKEIGRVINSKKTIFNLCSILNLEKDITIKII